MLAIFNKEIRAYFNSPMAWIMTSAYLFLVGLIFWVLLLNYADVSMRASSSPMGMGQVKVMDELVLPLLWWMGFLLLSMLPFLTMRLLAEERRSGTLELLFTYPLSDFQIVAGKFFAALTVVACMLGLSASTMLMLWKFTPVEWPVIGVGYLGLVLLGASFVAFGLWASSLSGSQLVAAVISYGGLMVMWLLSAVGQKFPQIKDYVGEPSIMAHLENMAKGVLNSHDVVYYVAWSGLFLFLTVRVLDSRKWRG